MEKTRYQKQIDSIEKKYDSIHKKMIEELKQAIIDHECCGITISDPQYEIKIGDYINAIGPSTLVLSNGKLLFSFGNTDESEYSNYGMLLLKDEKEIESHDFSWHEILPEENVDDCCVGEYEEMNLKLFDLYKHFMKQFEIIDQEGNPVVPPDSVGMYKKLCVDYNVPQTVCFEKNREQFVDQSIKEVSDKCEDVWEELQCVIRENILEGIASVLSEDAYNDKVELFYSIAENIAREITYFSGFVPDKRQGWYFRWLQDNWTPSTFAFGIEIAKMGIDNFIFNNKAQLNRLIEGLDLHYDYTEAESQILNFSFQDGKDCAEFNAYNNWPLYPLLFSFSKETRIFVNWYIGSLDIPHLCFWNAEVEELYLSDDIRSINQSAFIGCENLRLISVSESDFDKVKEMLPDNLKQYVEPRKVIDGEWIVCESTKMVLGCVDGDIDKVRRLPDNYNIVNLQHNLTGTVIIPSNTTLYHFAATSSIILEGENINFIDVYGDKEYFWGSGTEKVIVPQGLGYRQQPWAEDMKEECIEEWAPEQIEEYKKANLKK